MSFVQEEEIVEVSNLLNENVVPQVDNSESSSLKNNPKFKTSSSSSVTVTKRYLSKFRREWLSDPKYSSFLEECKNDTTRALCIICNIQFSTQNSGLTDINNHMKSKKHQEYLKSSESNKSKTVNSIFNSATSELNRLCAAEEALVFHGVKHSHSYLSQSCTTNLTKKCFSDSVWAKNITYSKTKAREIACNVLAPAFTKSFIQDLQSVAYFSICYDASNKGNAKMLPIVAQYFSDFGVKHGIIEFIEQKDESADGLFVNIKCVLESHELELEKVSSLGSDNTNVNVGNNHSVFSLFKELIPLLIKGNCYCHILHNSVKHGHDHLLFDIEAAILKIYAHFCRSSVRSQELGKYFEFIDQEQKVILQHIRIRWLSLLQSIERLIVIYPVVKSYFLNLKNKTCPKILIEFFTSHKGECSLLFLKNILTEVQEANILLQKHCITGVNLYCIIKDLLSKLNNRLRDNFCGVKVMDLLEKIHDSNETNDLKESFRLFIHTIITYIEDYFEDRALFYQSISIFSENNIEKIEWKSIERCASYIGEKTIGKDRLYNNFNHLKSKFIQMKDKFGGIDKQAQKFISSNVSLYKQSRSMSNDENNLSSAGESDDEAKSDTDNEDIRYHKNLKKHRCIRCDYLWAYLLHGENVPEFKKLVHFVFSMPASNAFCESVFSHMKYLWNNNRSNMKHELVGAELKIKVNSQYNCSEFDDYLLKNQNLLKQIRSTEKYSHIAEVPRTV